MGRIDPRKLRSLNGRLGYLHKAPDGSWMFVSKHNHKLMWKNLQKWEIREAIKHTRVEK